MVVPFKDLHENSKVWIYQSNRTFSAKESDTIDAELASFLEQWTSHQAQLYTFGQVIYGRFLFIFVDEQFAGASGCSIDTSVRFIKELEQKFDTLLMERTEVAYMQNENDFDNIHFIPLASIKKAFADHVIGESTYVFDNLVKTKSAFETSWVKPILNSWHKRFL